VVRINSLQPVDEDSEMELNSLPNSKPVDIMVKWRHILTSPDRVDKSRGSMENRLESIQMLCRIRKTVGHSRTTVVESR